MDNIKILYKQYKKIDITDITDIPATLIKQAIYYFSQCSAPSNFAENGRHCKLQNSNSQNWNH